MTVHRRRDPLTLAREAAQELARADPRNARLLGMRSLPGYLPWVALYPLQFGNLVLIAALGAGLWLGTRALVGLWLAVPMAIAAVAYLLEVIAHTANGYGTAPTFTVDHFQRGGDALEASLLLLLALGSVVWSRLAGAPALEAAVLVGWGVLLPGAAVLLALERTLTAALDPTKLWAFLAHGGIAYWTMTVVAALLLYVAPGALPGMPANGIDLVAGRDASGSWIVFPLLYLAMAVAHLLGALAHRRRAALGLPVLLEAKTEHEHAHESLAESVARLWKLVDARVDAEEHLAAEDLLRTASPGAHPLHPFLEALFDGALLRPKAFLAVAVGERLIATLVASKSWPRALEVFVTVSDRWPPFRIAAPAERVALARAAFERGHTLALGRLTADWAALGATPEAVELALLAARWRLEHDHDAAAALAELAPFTRAGAPPLPKRVAAFLAALRGSAGR